MSNKDDIKDRLLASDAVTSLMAEQEVVAAFKRSEWWDVQHGGYYRDRETGKLRELDVWARRSWSGPGIDSNVADLELFIEVKSLRDYHIVLAPQPGGQDTLTQRAWFGHYQDRLGQFLVDSGVQQELAARMVDRLRELAYPKPKQEMTVSKLVVSPPKAPVYATAFRETNVGKEKELDQSVLWRAIQALTSAVESSRERRDALFLDALKGQINVALEDDEDPAPAIERELARAVRYVTIFHPVVVVDARLWVSRGDRLEEIDHGRFTVDERDRFPRRWFDIVTRRSFPDWITSLTEHYRSNLEHPNEAIWKENANAWITLFDIMHRPDTEVEMRVRKRGSKEPGQVVLLKTYPRKKKRVAKPIAVKERRDSK